MKTWEPEAQNAQGVHENMDDNIKINKSLVNWKIFKGKLPRHKNSINKSAPGSNNQREEDARILINPEQILRTYMSDGWRNIKESARVKLIVSAISLHNPPSFVKDTFVKICGIAELGLVHTAVQIGPIILEWNDSSIVIPCQSQEWYSSKVLLAFDIKTLTEEEFFKDYANEVCKVITNWNGNYEYGRFTNHCQRFSSEILQALNVDTSILETGKVKKFLDSVSSTDSLDLCFKHKFPNDPREYEFKKHSDLDEVCFSKSDSGELIKDSEDWRLLKAYDRVFWLRYNGVAQSKKLSEQMKENLKKQFKCAKVCYFGDPTASDTMFATSEDNYY